MSAAGRAVTVRGRAVGGMAAVWLEPGTGGRGGAARFPRRPRCTAGPGLAARQDAGADLGQSRLPAPPPAPRTKPSAIASQTALDKSERDLASAARSEGHTHGGQALRRGRRPSPRPGLHRMSPSSDDGIVGTAIDVTDVSDAEARLQQHIDAHADTLDKLATAVAIFGKAPEAQLLQSRLCAAVGTGRSLARPPSQRRRNPRPAARRPQTAGAARLPGLEARAAGAL